MNVYDSTAIFGLLGGDGFAASEDPLTADVVLINTCSVRDHAEHKVLSRVGELRRDREAAGSPPAVMGILGCMAERMGKALTESRQRVDVVVGVDGYDTLPAILTEKLAGRRPGAPRRRHGPPGRRPLRRPAATLPAERQPPGHHPQGLRLQVHLLHRALHPGAAAREGAGGHPRRGPHRSWRPAGAR